VNPQRGRQLCEHVEVVVPRPYGIAMNARALQSRLTQHAQWPVGRATNADEELGQRGDGDPGIAIGWRSEL
jgi:hypothetical protein